MCPPEDSVDADRRLALGGVYDSRNSSMGERRGERDADVNPPRPRDAKKAEAHLSDPITSSIASASPDSIMLLDREGRIRFINHPAPTLTNEQVLGTSVYDYVSADQHAAMRACFEYILATGQPSRYDNVFRPPDEAASFWESRVGAVKEGGAITGLVVIASNVTERRGAAADRDLFFKLSLDLYCVADPRGFFRRVNPAFERTLGWSEAELLSQPFLEFVHEEDRERTVAAVQQLGQGQNVLDFVNRYRRKDGTYIVLSWRGTSDPETQMIYATARDVTERLALEERLRRSQKMDALGQLAGGIAHDFNNLLLVMMGNLELALVPDGTAASVVNPIREAQRACERAADLTRHLLTFSRRQPPHLAGVDVNEIVTTTLKLLERVLPASIAIEFVPEAELPRVSADRSQMEQVLMNLSSTHAMRCRAAGGWRCAPKPSCSTTIAAAMMPRPAATSGSRCPTPDTACRRSCASGSSSPSSPPRKRAAGQGWACPRCTASCRTTPAWCTCTASPAPARPSRWICPRTGMWRPRRQGYPMPRRCAAARRSSSPKIRTTCAESSPRTCARPGTP